jgi:hypothetical protein
MEMTPSFTDTGPHIDKARIYSHAKWMTVAICSYG